MALEIVFVYIIMVSALKDTAKTLNKYIIAEPSKASIPDKESLSELEKVTLAAIKTLLARILESTTDEKASKGQPLSKAVKFTSDTKLIDGAYKNIGADSDKIGNRESIVNENLLLALYNLIIRVYNLLDYHELQKGNHDKQNQEKVQSLISEVQKISKKSEAVPENIAGTSTPDQAILVSVELYKWIHQICDMFDKNPSLLNPTDVPRDATFNRLNKYLSTGQMDNQKCELSPAQEMRMELAKLGAKVSKLSKGRYEDQRVPQDYKGLNNLIESISKMQQRSYENQRFHLGPCQQYKLFIAHISKLIVKGNNRRMTNQDYISTSEVRKKYFEEVSSKIDKLNTSYGDNQRYEISPSKDKEMFFVSIMKKMNKYDGMYDNQRSMTPDDIKMKKLCEIEDLVEKINSKGNGMSKQRYLKPEFCK